MKIDNGRKLLTMKCSADAGRWRAFSTAHIQLDEGVSASVKRHRIVDSLAGAAPLASVWGKGEAAP